jgi:hypothetical protein
VVRGILLLVGLALLVLPSVLTVTADRDVQRLTLHRRSLWKESTQEIPFAEIEAIQMEINQNRSSSSSGPAYRIVVIRKDGEEIPFSRVYSSGTADKTRKIKKLREFIGVGGSEMGMGLMGTLRAATEMAREAYQEQQEELTGSLDEIHSTSDVHWQVQTRAFGGSPITRWFSPDYQVADGFVYIAQLAEGQKMSGGGLLASMSGFLFKQSLSIYGFGREDTPGIERASMLSPLAPGLAAFSVYTSVPDPAQKTLNPRVAAALADWARRYPLQQIHSETVFSQLVVMFSPKGVYVTSMGTMIPEAIEDMTRLGVELVKSQHFTPESGITASPS